MKLKFRRIINFIKSYKWIIDKINFFLWFLKEIFKKNKLWKE